ncbi:MAG: alpha/beta hydrolase [Microbacterium sp.]|uniref:alpha/beta hydrolase n=1 Tax=Microbacterium sp. TaxID=51671 RepID=UPI001AC51F2E|nr:alpha/beta hydrolase [Microbacterium sp.]MBN9155598.1 alpha/beta hydrolase [Microbacterium sp.]
MNAHPPIDPELAAYLPAVVATRPFLDGLEGVARLRAAMAEFEESVDDVRSATGARIDERTIDGVPVIVVLPPGEPDLAADGSGAAPRGPGLAPGGGPTPGERRRGAILNVHGGGLVAGSSRSVLGVNVRMAMDLGCAMVIPDYRLAPEHPYPAGLDDVHAVWGWLAGGGLGAEVDPRRLIVMGGSAGGLLSAGLMLRLIARGGTLPRALALVQPQLDDRNTRPSTFEVEYAHFWDRPSNVFSFEVYLAGLDGEVPVEAAAARAEDLSGFPPTYVEIGQVDVFRDEELDFAARLSRAGVPVEAHLWAGAFHGFDGLAQTRVAQRAVAARLEYLRGMLAPPQAPQE